MSTTMQEARNRADEKRDRFEIHACVSGYLIIIPRRLSFERDYTFCTVEETWAFSKRTDMFAWLRKHLSGKDSV